MRVFQRTTIGRWCAYCARVFAQSTRGTLSDRHTHTHAHTLEYAWCGLIWLPLNRQQMRTQCVSVFRVLVCLCHMHNRRVDFVDVYTIAMLDY